MIIMLMSHIHIKEWNYVLSLNRLSYEVLYTFQDRLLLGSAMYHKKHQLLIFTFVSPFHLEP